jgi:hypothetical protein
LPLPASDLDREDSEPDDPSFNDLDLDTDSIDAIENGGVYTPPTDPVVGVGSQGEIEVLGGTEPTALDSGIEPERSALDGSIGDDALETAIRDQLRLDAATTDLEPAVRVVARGGVAYLHGTVPSLEDAENVEAVASGVPGVLDVEENLSIQGL